MSEELRNWRDGLAGPLIEEIECAILQFHADERYELLQGKLSDTIARLRRIETYSNRLRTAVEELSPVGMAAIHEEGKRREVVTGRYELGALARSLEPMPKIAAAAAERLLAMHSPLPDQGQGAGSAVGRDSDLRAVKARHDSNGFSFEFRSPKDKLGVAVLEAYFRHTPRFTVSERGAGRFLNLLLQCVWEDVRPGRPTNWKRLVHARGELADAIAGEFERAHARKRARANGNASSAERGRSPFDETSSYSIAPGQSGEVDVDIKSETGGGAPRTER